MLGNTHDPVNVRRFPRYGGRQAKGHGSKSHRGHSSGYRVHGPGSPTGYTSGYSPTGYTSGSGYSPTEYGDGDGYSATGLASGYTSREREDSYGDYRQDTGYGGTAGYGYRRLAYK